MAKDTLSRKEATGKAGEIQTIKDVELQIANLYDDEPAMEHETTVDDMAKIWGISKSATRSRLARLVDSGDLSVRYATIGGNRISVYRQVCE